MKRVKHSYIYTYIHMKRIIDMNWQINRYKLEFTIRLVMVYSVTFLRIITLYSKYFHFNNPILLFI